jgi:drug/metabolite transporter (DMT)-like permease
MATGKINKSMTALEWSMLIGLALLWGESYFFNGVAVKELPTFTVVVGRVAIAAVILQVWLRLARIPFNASPSLWAAFFGMGLLNNVIPFTLIVWGQSQIASGLAAILNATTPVFGVLVAHALTADERLTGGKIVGVLLGIVGVAILVGGDLLGAIGVNVLAQIACLAAALSYAFAGVFGRRFRTMDLSPTEAAAGQVTASSVILVPIMFWVDQPWSLAMPSQAAIWSLIGVGALSTALAYVLYFRILATAGATNLLLVTLLVPVGAILLGTAFLGETLASRHLLGMPAIALGLVAIDGRAYRRLSSAPQST